MRAKEPKHCTMDKKRMEVAVCSAVLPTAKPHRAKLKVVHYERFGTRVAKRKAGVVGEDVFAPLSLITIWPTGY